MWPGRLSTSIVSWVCEPADKLGAGARPARVTHCRFEHAGQNFGSLDRGPRAAHPMEWNGFDWRASEVGARRKTKQNPAMVEPVEIPDAEHELVVERAAAIDVAKATGKVCVRLPGKSGRRFSRVWDVPGCGGSRTWLPSLPWPRANICGYSFVFRARVCTATASISPGRLAVVPDTTRDPHETTR